MVTVHFSSLFTKTLFMFSSILVVSKNYSFKQISCNSVVAFSQGNTKLPTRIKKVPTLIIRVNDSSYQFKSMICMLVKIWMMEIQHIIHHGSRLKTGYESMIRRFLKKRDDQRMHTFMTETKVPTFYSTNDDRHLAYLKM